MARLTTYNHIIYLSIYIYTYIYITIYIYIYNICIFTSIYKIYLHIPYIYDTLRGSQTAGPSHVPRSCAVLGCRGNGSSSRSVRRRWRGWTTDSCWRRWRWSGCSRLLKPRGDQVVFGCFWMLGWNVVVCWNQRNQSSIVNSFNSVFMILGTESFGETSSWYFAGIGELLANHIYGGPPATFSWLVGTRRNIKRNLGVEMGWSCL